MAADLPFPRFLAKTNITVTLTGGLDEDGAPAETTVYAGKCIYNEKSRQVLNAERQLVLLSAKAVIEGDIAPGVDIQGYVRVAGQETKRRIFQALRPRNPGGSVFSTELDLM